MAPLIIKTLLHAGPALLRLVGDSKGGQVGEIAEVAAKALEATHDKPQSTRAAALDIATKGIPKELLIELQVALADIEAQREKNVLDHDLGMHESQQQTLRSNGIQGVRPGIANRHSWFVIAYLFLFEAAAVLDYGTGASWEIATLIASPTLAWFGFRTWDKFSLKGAS
ncbi:MAG: hypothetical protein Alis3KO_00830 [Aliiglaciecola sp.]